MQGQRGVGKSFAETIDLNHGSGSSNSGPNQPTSWNGMLCPMDNLNVQVLTGRHIGESSYSASPNLQSQGLGGNVKNESSFDNPIPMETSNSLLQESLSRPLSGSSCTPLSINLNSEHVVSGSGSGSGLEQSDAFPYNIGNNDGASSSSLCNWGSSFKREALDGASSNFFQQGETFDLCNFHACHSGSSSSSLYIPPLHSPSSSHYEELSLRIGVGKGVDSDVFPPISKTETAESSSGNYGFKVNNDYNQFNIPSLRNATRQSDLRNHHQSSRPITPSDTFEFRPASSSARSQSPSTRAPDLLRNMPPFAFQGSANSRAGGSSGSAMISDERGFLSRNEGNSASITRNSTEHSTLTHFSDIRNNLNLSSENVRNSASQFPSPWATHQRSGSSRNVQRSSHFNLRAPFSPHNSESGNWRGDHFPPLRSGPSHSDETMMPSGANQGHHHHILSMRSSMMMELPDDDMSGWHALAADMEGSQRLVSEIRHVLNAMRRGDNLRDEDHMLFDPFINGIAEFHDRHRDMRLDVDNMSYEELLALEERIGDVNTGLSEEAILRSMKQRKHLCLFDRSSSTCEPCSICREDYVLGDDVGELDCGHDFHIDCIKQWLTQKNLCPICKTTALGT